MKYNDYFWCLDSNLLDNLDIDLSDLANIGILWGGLGNLITDKILDWVIKRNVEKCIQYMVEQPLDSKLIEETMYDFLSYQYLWNMGNVCRKLKGSIMPLLKGVYDYITTDKGFIDSWANRYDIAFVKVPHILSQESFVILTNLRYNFELISEKQYRHYLKKYCLPTHVDYEELVAPSSHNFAGTTTINLILHTKHELVDEYFSKKYKSIYPRKVTVTGTDNSKIFYDHTNSIPIGDRAIYELNKQ